MKKFLALLTIFFTAIANNLEPVQVDDMLFASDGYYAGRTHTEVDYQGLYNDYIDESGQLSDGCNISPKSAGSTANKTNSNTGRIWFIYENPSKENKDGTTTQVDGLEAARKRDTFDDKKAVSLHANDGETIIAPATCKITSSANKSRGGTEMTITVGDFEVTFTNMARWYCCAKRSPSLEENINATFSHTKDAKGTVMHKGDILGYATSKTKVTIRKLGSNGTYKKSSLSKFYD